MPLIGAVYITLELTMPWIEAPQSISPREYELAVKGILDGAGVDLSEFSSQHLDGVSGVDGSYVIDVTVRFKALGAEFLVLVECKDEGRKVERHAVLVLHDKVRSTGAQKGMLFSLAGFQRGQLSTPKSMELH